MSSPRRATLLAGLLALTVACSDAPLAPEDPSVAEARGGNGKGKGGGGGDDPDPAPPVTDELDTWDGVQWTAEHHTLGKGLLDRTNVSQGPIGLLLTLPAGAYDGAEIASAQRHRYRNIEARMKTPIAPGSISALFFYEGVRKRNDEIDIEIFNDDSHEIMFTTWVQGRQTNNVRVPLPFDPSAAYHDYRIEWSPGRVAFYVDGSLMTEFTTGVPGDAMYILSNVWWPTWLNGPTLTAADALEIDRIVY
jgi:beta-glucanase (GH16 family)